MLEFDHVGVVVAEPRPGENWVEQSRCWVTNPRDHPERIEFLRFREDSTVPQAIRENPHVAFRVDQIAPHLEGSEVLMPPFVVDGFVEVAFIRKHGAVFEYMRYLKDGWFGK